MKVRILEILLFLSLKAYSFFSKKLTYPPRMTSCLKEVGTSHLDEARSGFLAALILSVVQQLAPYASRRNLSTFTWVLLTIS